MELVDRWNEKRDRALRATDFMHIDWLYRPPMRCGTQVDFVFIRMEINITNVVDCQWIIPDIYKMVSTVYY